MISKWAPGRVTNINDQLIFRCMQVVPSLAIHDTMRYVKSDVSTLAFGGAMGMMGFLLACGAKVEPRLSH